MVFANTVGTNSRDVKSQNISAILLALLRQPHISRAYLAQTLGVSNATVSNLIGELSEQGLVEESGILRNEGQVGRPQRELQLVANARYAIGVHIDVDTVYIGLSNLIGQLLDIHSFQHDLTRSWQVVLDEIVQIIQDLREQHHLNRQEIIAVGVAASGLVDFDTGLNIFASNLKWSNVPIGDYLKQKLALPIVVENNVRAMAFGEAMFGVAQNSNALAFIYGRIGVGAGFVVRGQLFRGAGAGAGEIGHSLLMVENSGTYQAQSLEMLVSETKILALARDLLAQEPASSLTFAEILTLARSGHEKIIALLEERAFFVGIALANLVNIFNPELIVLGGTFSQAHDIMMPTIEATMRKNAFANLGQGVELKLTSFGQQAGTIGSAAIALDRYFYRS